MKTDWKDYFKSFWKTYNIKNRKYEILTYFLFISHKKDKLYDIKNFKINTLDQNYFVKKLENIHIDADIIIYPESNSELITKIIKQVSPNAKYVRFEKAKVYEERKAALDQSLKDIKHIKMENGNFIDYLISIYNYKPVIDSKNFYKNIRKYIYLPFVISQTDKELLQTISNKSIYIVDDSISPAKCTMRSILFAILNDIPDFDMNQIKILGVFRE